MTEKSLAERPEAAPLTLQEVQKFIVPQPDNVPDDQYMRDTQVFLRFCSSEDLNPFASDIYLIYRNTNIGSRDRPKWAGKASIQVGIGGWLKRAARNPNYDGYKSGVVVEGGKRYPGTLVLEDEPVIGGWAEIHRKDRIPTEVVVSVKEYGQDKAIWKDKPDTMIEKTAIVQGLRRTFPDEFEGLKEASAEIGIEVGGDGPPPNVTVPRAELTAERTQEAFHGEAEEIVVDGEKVNTGTGEIVEGEAKSDVFTPEQMAEQIQRAQENTEKADREFASRNTEAREPTNDEMNDRLMGPQDAKGQEFDQLGNPAEDTLAKFTVPAKVETEADFLKIIESLGKGGADIHDALGVGVDSWVKGHKKTHREALIECLDKWGDVEYLKE